ncbi:MAG: hypothetical protein J7500_12390 [Sphingomonas sp.]|uniref:hypothetical protein n=1 Tax=Sphingomonas sp. TaxID=28214 RepID=UPI001B2455C7|nr:hypothetical protein [Sphingomonas sp.]MBO9623500.1 hypothetical protein [Sphingomonas sp.]
MSLLDFDRSPWRELRGGLVLLLLLPFFVLFLLIKLVLLPFERPSHRPAEDIAEALRHTVDSTGSGWEFDDFISVPLADPRLESIRERALQWDGGEDVQELEVLADEAEAIALADRTSLVELLDRALSPENVVPEDLDSAIPYPRSLGRLETKAFEALSHWLDDGDIRARDAAYASRQREGLLRCLDPLRAEVRR